MEENLKKIYFALVTLVLVPLVLIACASTKIETADASDFHFSKYNTVLIFGNFDNYKKNNTLYRDMLESEVKKQFSLTKIKAYNSLEARDFIGIKSDSFEISNTSDVELLLNIAIPSCSTSFDRNQVKMKTKFDITVFDAKSKKILFECSAVTTEKGSDLSDCMNNTFASLSKRLVRI